MQKVIEKVIESKNYELSDMLKKIDTLWVQGSISDDVRTRLYEKARNNANVQKSMDILAKVEEMDRRIKALEDAKANEETPEDGTTSYPQYQAGKWYYSGDIVTFEGSAYTCIAPDGTVCVWSPSEYPSYWELLEEP